jgi:L-alanine-DL-glutamate epimerase-like enolase superfamily enzyme
MARDDSTESLAAPNVRITDVIPYVMERATFVEVRTDAGVSGWGEGDHDNRMLIAEVVERLCKPICVGQSPFASEYIWNQTFYRGEDAGQSGLLTGAIAGVDNALWDLKGKLLDVPAYKLMGSSGKERTLVYGSYGRNKKGGKKTADEMAAEAMEFVDQGYRAVKARMQIRQLGIDPYPDDVFEVVRAVRKAIGDDIILFVDYNNGYTPARAIMQTLKLYEHFNIAGVEEPVTYQNMSDLAQVVDAVPVPVLSGEHTFNRWQARDLMVEGKVDILNTDAIKAGGISENLKMAHFAAAMDKPIMAHSTRPTLALSANLQVVAAVSNTGRFQEYGGPRRYMNLQELFEEEIRYEDGYLYLPEGPGLGLTVRPEAMERRRLNK